MARVVDEFPEGPEQSRYPWGQWLDGSIWELTHGEDFNGKPNTFRANARVQAKKRGGTIRARVVRDRNDPDAPNRVYIQFIAPDAQLGM